MLPVIVFCLALLLTMIVIRATIYEAVNEYERSDMPITTLVYFIVSVLWSWLFYLLH